MDPEPLTEPFNIGAAIDAEVRRLRSEGYSMAYICERSFEIEDEIRARHSHPQGPAKG